MDESQNATARPSVCVSGAAFPLTLRVLAVVAVLALGWQAWRTLQALPVPIVQRDTLLLAGLAASIVLAGLWHILKARTSINATHVTQTGLWTRQLALADVRRVDILHLPGLAWLIAPRARLHTAGRGSYVIHASDPQVLERLWRLALGEQTQPGNGAAGA
ncbi:MAG: hypothetical protein O9318_05460 [Hylemonella sp.]|uniref:hypothetical protein n=1 Tax=Hylemonella sp. TaxID=2066020 RepID=UPI0022C75C26|nr:hypothetical protein [Hylemonella sp.]MCZ8251894.1 hypothetical protein [Hylemonella sp.]